MAKLCDSCSDSIVGREIARFFSFISISDRAKAGMLENGILLHLLQFARRSDIETQRYSSLALCNLCLSRKQKTNVLQHHGLVKTNGIPIWKELYHILLSTDCLL